MNKKEMPKVSAGNMATFHQVSLEIQDLVTNSESFPTHLTVPTERSLGLPESFHSLDQLETTPRRTLGFLIAMESLMDSCLVWFQDQKTFQSYP